MKSLTVKVGDRVEVVLNGKVQKLEIVESPETNPNLGKISFLSPLGEAIIGQRYSSKVHFQAPNGQVVECLLLRPAV